MARYMCTAAAALVLSLGGAHAANVFVSARGSDSNNGSGPGAPLRTLSRALNRAGSNGTVYLERGSVFREETNISGTSLAAYGDAKKPRARIAGSVRIANFKPHEGEIYVAHVDVGKDINHLFVDGKRMWIARYPNSGWLRTKKGSKASLLVDGDLASHPRNKPGYFEGAQVRWRRWSWWFETRPITNYDGRGNLVLGGKEYVGHHTGIGSAYFIDNKLEELDAPGEWYWDAENKDVYLWAPGGGEPNGLLVEGSCLKQCSASDCTVSGVTFSQFETGLRIRGKITVKDCRFEHNRTTAISATTQSGALIKGNEFVDNLNVGIAWFNWNKEDRASVIEDNVMRRTGTVGGYGGSGAWHAAAIIIYGGEGLRVRYNLIDECGYAGIIMGAEKNHAEYNVIRKAMATLNDGGGIYTNCHRSYIKGNIIIDTVGNLETSHPWYPLGHGIWLEFLGDFRESVVEDNLVIGSGGFGIFLPKNYDCVIRNNRLYNNEIGQFQLSDSNNPEHTVKDNVLFAKGNQPTLVYKGDTNWGTFENNIFASDGGSHIKGNGTMTVSSWQGKCSWADKTAREIKTGRMRVRVVANNSKEKREIALDGGGWMDARGGRYSKSIELEPYDSRILFGGAGGAEIVLYKGIDEGKEDVTLAAAKKKPRSRKIAQPKFVRRKASADAVALMDGILQMRLTQALADGEKVTLFVSSFRQSMRVAEMDDDMTLKLKGKGGVNMNMEWPRLSHAEKRGLSAKIAKVGNEDDAFLVAFYALAQNDERGAREYLAACPSRAEDIEALFEVE